MNSIIDIKKAQIIRSKNIKMEKYGVLNVKTLFNTSNMDGFSAAIIELAGKNKETVSEIGNRFYYILKGKGKFYIEGKKYNVSEGDLVFIPKKVKYFDEGKMTMLSLSHPRFKRENFK